MNKHAVPQYKSQSVWNAPRLLLLAIMTMVLILPGVLYADVTARLDRNTIVSGDTVTLRITTSDKDAGQQPDLTALQKDFDVVGTSRSNQIHIINGQRSYKFEWHIELAPHRTGELIVPSLSIANSKTPELTLKVSEQQETANSESGQAVFIRSEISPASGDTYVQQQILYTTRLYYRVPLIEGSFSELKIENAVVERLGEDTQYNTTVDGQNYQVVERRYAIFPERSGKLDIKPLIFSGRTMTTSRQRSSTGRTGSLMEQMLQQRGFNDSFFAGSPFADPGKRVRLSSDALSLDIKARPQNVGSQHWLPTEKFQLQDSWETTPPVIKAGEPVTRVLTLEAKGLEASQLPELKLTGTDSHHIYTEQPIQSNRTDGDWVYGRSEQKFTYVASQQGKIQLPPITVTWWDTILNKQQTTTLPAREIMVLAGSGQSSSPLKPKEQTANSSSTISMLDTINPTNTADADSAATSSEHQVYWLMGTGSILILLVIGYLVRKQIKKRSSDTDPANSDTSSAVSSINQGKVQLKDITSRLHDACIQSNPQDAAHALLDWATHTWPEQTPRSLGAIALKVTSGQKTIRELELILYGPGGSKWNGQQLWEEFNNSLINPGMAQDDRKTHDNTPPLYPDWHNHVGTITRK